MKVYISAKVNPSQEQPPEHVMMNSRIGQAAEYQKIYTLQCSEEKASSSPLFPIADRSQTSESVFTTAHTGKQTPRIVKKSSLKFPTMEENEEWLRRYGHQFAKPEETSSSLSPKGVQEFLPEFDHFENLQITIVSEPHSTRTYKSQVALLQSIQQTVAETEQLPNEGSLVGFLDSFKYTHYPPYSPNFTIKSNDWRNEAFSLFNEFERLRKQAPSSSGMWPSKDGGNSSVDDVISDDGVNENHSIENENAGQVAEALTFYSTRDDSTISDAETDEYEECSRNRKIQLSPIGSKRPSSHHGCLRRLKSSDSGYQSRSESTDTENMQDSSISPVKRDSFCDSFSHSNSWSNIIYCSDMCSPDNTGNVSMPLSKSIQFTEENKCGVYQRHKKWITEEILEMIAVRDKLYKRMKKHPSPDIINMYKKVRNMVVGMTRNAKRAHEKKEDINRTFHRTATGSKLEFGIPRNSKY